MHYLLYSALGHMKNCSGVSRDGVSQDEQESRTWQQVIKTRQGAMKTERYKTVHHNVARSVYLNLHRNSNTQSLTAKAR